MFTDSQLETARSLRHHFHQHPELKFEETQTAHCYDFSIEYDRNLST